MRLLVAALSAIGVLAQTVSAPPPTGAIVGVITDSENGAPLLDLTVSLNGRITTKTDSRGQYKFADLAPGSYFLNLSGANIASDSSKDIKLGAGENTTADFSVELAGSISGTVTSWDKMPVAHASVLLIARTYQYGKPGYGQAMVEQTDSKGRYNMEWVLPGRAYAVLAKTAHPMNPAISNDPEDPDERAPVATPTFSPNSESFEAAQLVTLRSGQKREDVDIQMVRAKAWCAQGILQAEGRPAMWSLEFEESQPPNDVGNLGSGVRIPPRHGGSENGRFRICGLHPGEYSLVARPGYLSPTPFIGFFTLTPLTVVNKDISDLRIQALSPLSLSGEVVLEDDAPSSREGRKFDLHLKPVSPLLPATNISALLPGAFQFTRVPSAECAISITGLPRGFYVKEIDYGGASVRNRSFLPGSSTGGLKIVVAHDAGTVTATVKDSDGHPVSSAGVWFLPESASSPAELEPVLVGSQSNSDGLAVVDTLPPGKYRVLAVTARLDHSAAHIDKLWAARWKATEVDLPPNGAAQVTLQPIAIN
jgi:hypothetical protein